MRICSVLSRILLIEIDFCEIGLESSTILECKVCAFQAWRSISVWNEGGVHATAHMLSIAKLCCKYVA